MSSNEATPSLEPSPPPHPSTPTMVVLPPRLNTNTNTNDSDTAMIHNTTDPTLIADADDGATETISLLDATPTASATATATNMSVDTSRDAEIAAAIAAEEAERAGLPPLSYEPNPSSTTGTSTGTTTTSSDDMNMTNYTVATVSAPWQYDDLHGVCCKCHNEFHPIVNRKHHCRYCGYVFCHSCTIYKALIPPSLIVLHPITGKKTKPPDPNQNNHISFSPNPDPDRMLTYVVPGSGSGNGSATDVNGGGEQQVLYGKGLEERFQLSREPLRVCHACHQQLQPLQEDLRYHNSHAMRYNTIDPTHPQRLFNSPFANTLGHEIRKAAYALNNLLPQPKRRMGALVDIPEYGMNNNNNPIHADIQHCKDTCTSISPNLHDLDGVQIPARLLEMAKGVAILTVVKGGFGFVGGEFGTGLVVARLPNLSIPHPHTSPTSSTDQSGGTGSNLQNGANFRWSAPSAIGTAGISWGALIGAQVSDHVFLLMSDEAVALLYNNKASIQLGADIGIAIGPVGRTLEGDLGVDGKHNKIAPIYTYSMSKGLYAGVSLDGKVIVTRPDVNEKFYGMSISAEEILAGVVPTPPAAQPLYEALHRCHVYATMAETKAKRMLHSQPQVMNIPQQHSQYAPTTTMLDESSYMPEYGEHQSQPPMLQSNEPDRVVFVESAVPPPYTLPHS